MNLLPDILNSIKTDLEKDITLSLSNEEIAKNIFPYIDKLYQQKNYVKNHAEQLKRSITPKEKGE